MFKKQLPVSIEFYMKSGFFLLISLLLNGQLVFAQINFQKFPKNNQVLQRNEANEAVLSIKGKVIENGHSSVSLIVLKDGNAYYQKNISLGSSTSFDFSTILIAGKYNYTVKIYLDNTQEIKSVTRVAVGDVFLIYGQSNALGNSGHETYVPSTNPFIRAFYTDYSNINAFQWVLPFETFLRPGTGTMELQKLLCNENDFPIAVIGISIGGASIHDLSYRNPQNPTDINTNYGKMLSQLINSELKNELKYMVFRQGEGDSGHGKPLEYTAEFTKFYNNLVVDFPKLTKIFNFQIDILTAYAPNAGVLREFQRNSKNIFPKISVLSTVGTKGFDGLHYALEGYKQTAFELSRVISKEVYGKPFSNQIYSPDLKKAYTQNGKLVLEFDDSMEMTYPNDTTANGYFYQMKNFFSIDGDNTRVIAGVANGNRIILDVNNLSTAKSVSYLPNYFGEWNVQKYLGPHLKNKLGMRAFSFDKVLISEVSVPTFELSVNEQFELSVNEQVEVKLSWSKIDNYHIERAIGNSLSFSHIGTVNSDSFIDRNIEIGKDYSYRIYMENSVSTKSNIVSISLKCLDKLNLNILPSVNLVGANSSIIATFVVVNLKKISLVAPKSIELNPGFNAEFGSVFDAQIGGCNNN